MHERMAEVAVDSSGGVLSQGMRDVWGAVDALLRLAKEAEAAGVVLEEDPVGALMAPEAAAGKAWQDAARDIMTALQVQ